MSKKHLLFSVELMSAEVQPKNSYRYRFLEGTNAVESIYIKRSALGDVPPQKLIITIREE